MKALIPLGFAMLAGCTTIYQRGEKVFQTSSNLRGITFATPEGTTLTAETIDNAAVHKTIGGNVGSAAVSIGSAIATSGIVK